MVRGIDVSHYQGNIDWAAVKADGIDFAIMKCMYESSRKPDEYFERNYEGCVKNGIKVGAYIYLASRSINDTRGEAHAVADILGGRPLPYRLWFDIEDKSLMMVGREGINKIVSLESIVYEHEGYKLGVYSNKNWYDNTLDRRLTIQYPFWCARYPLVDTGEVVDRLSPQRYAKAWQYTQKGKVNGIKGYVDRDIDYVGLDEVK